MIFNELDRLGQAGPNIFLLNYGCMDWYYIDETITSGDRRIGPLSDDEIKGKAKEGVIKAETLVWHSGEENWRAWKEHEKELDAEATNEIIQQTLEAIIKEKERQAAVKPRFAGFWVRALAYAIDMIALSCVASIVMYMMSAFGLIDLATANEIMGNDIENLANADMLTAFMQVRGIEEFIVFCSVMQFVYFVGFTWLYSATPGKILLKLKVVSKDNQKLGLKGAIIRYLCSFISSLSLIYLYGLAYVVAAVDPEKRTFHDWLARTRVVYKDK